MPKFLRNFAIGALCVASLAACGSQSGPPTVTGDGFGKMRFGMTVAEAEQALGHKLVPFVAGSGEAEACRYYKADGALPNLAFMTADGVVVRLDVQPGSDVATDTGAKIGDSESHALELYKGRVEVQPHQVHRTRRPLSRRERWRREGPVGVRDRWCQGPQLSCGRRTAGSIRGGVLMIRSGFAVLLAAGAIGATVAGAATAPACDRQIVMQIDSARISAEPDGFLIDAFGVAESAGWSNPTLVVVGSDKAGIVHVDFVACRPEVSAQVLTPIQTRVTLDLDLATTRQIVIRAKTNTMTVEISK